MAGAVQEAKSCVRGGGGRRGRARLREQRAPLRCCSRAWPYSSSGKWGQPSGSRALGTSGSCAGPQRDFSFTETLRDKPREGAGVSGSNFLAVTLPHVPAASP